jgi:hypothetical protein
MSTGVITPVLDRRCAKTAQLEEFLLGYRRARNIQSPSSNGMGVTTTLVCTGEVTPPLDKIELQKVIGNALFY